MFDYLYAILIKLYYKFIRFLKNNSRTFASNPANFSRYCSGRRKKIQNYEKKMKLKNIENFLYMFGWHNATYLYYCIRRLILFYSLQNKYSKIWCCWFKTLSATTPTSR